MIWGNTLRSAFSGDIVFPCSLQLPACLFPVPFGFLFPLSGGSVLFPGLTSFLPRDLSLVLGGNHTILASASLLVCQGPACAGEPYSLPHHTWCEVRGLYPQCRSHGWRFSASVGFYEVSPVKNKRVRNVILKIDS